MSGLLAYAQGYYDDDLYYDASKAKKETPEATPPAYAGQTVTYSRSGQASAPAANAGMYYYDGAAYVPWDSVGDFRPAGSYLPSGEGSTRDVDEYNRRGGSYAYSTPDSISSQDFEEMPATTYLARFEDSQVAKDALAGSGYDTSYTDVYNAGYSSGYDAGYNANPSTSVSINFATGYPYGYYGYYNSWYWPYYSWNYPYYWYSPSWAWYWDYPYCGWGWSWGWTSPSWAWGWGHHHYYPGYWGGGHYRPSPSAAHRPRSSGYNRGSRGDYGGRYGHAVPGSSSRPGYRPPVSPGSNTPSSGNGGYYGGASSGRNSHFGASGSTGARPSGSSGYGNAGSSRPSGVTNGSSNRGNFGASQSTRNGSHNSGSNYSPSRSGSTRPSGGYSGGGRSGGSHSGGGGRSGGGGHRSR